MPIEFRCPECQRLLRTPDDAAGRQAQCPACGATVEIPSASTTEKADVFDATTSESTRPDPGAPRQQFELSKESDEITPLVEDHAQLGNHAGGGLPTDDANPYRSPVAYEREDRKSPAAEVGGLIPSRVDFGESFSRTWVVFSEQFGLCVVLGLVLIALLVAVYSVIFIGIFVVLGLFSSGDQLTAIYLGVALAVVVGFPMFVGSIWITAGCQIFALRLIRGARATLQDIFHGGPYLVRAVGASLFVLSLHGIAYLILVVPGIVLDGSVVSIIGNLAFQAITTVINLFVFLSIYMIVDRDLGVIESIRNSVVFMRGNKLMVFLIQLAVFILGSVGTIFTCSAGLLFVVPYVILLNAVIYLQATGQRAGFR